MDDPEINAYCNKNETPDQCTIYAGKRRLGVWNHDSESSCGAFHAEFTLENERFLDEEQRGVDAAREWGLID
ncbi:MAG: hypothetical protein ABI041_20655 [Bdellovibrionia bacterium]